MRIVVVTNGALDDPRAEIQPWIGPEDWIVAADGGSLHVLAAGLTPQHVIGDLDSLPSTDRERLAAAGTHFSPYPREKNETDLELALGWAARQDADEIIILGSLGGRPDQEVGNLLLLALPALAGQRVQIVARPWTIRLIRAGEIAAFSGQPGDLLSLLPLGGEAHGITTTGLAYPLRDEPLRPGSTRGISNVLLGTEATVQLSGGLLWAFHQQLSL